LGGLKQKRKTVNFSVVAFVIFSTKKKKTFLPRAVAANTQDLNFSGNLFDVYC
jgi:hypothetical protein